MDVRVEVGMWAAPSSVQDESGESLISHWVGSQFTRSQSKTM